MGERRDFNDPKYRAWRKAVFKRDGFRCLMPDCPGLTRKLNAHHIKRWADAPGLRFVVSNGISLCKTCHKRVTGFEGEYEGLFMRLVGSPASEFMIEMLFKRYG